MNFAVSFLFAILSLPHEAASFVFPPQQHHVLRRSEMLSLAASSQQEGGPVLIVGFVGQLAANQALIGSAIWTGGPGAEVLARDAHFRGLGWLLLGLVGATPLILFSSKVETSESPLFASSNLSTDMTALRIFGGKSQPILAFIASAFLGGLTGLVEEVAFRGEVLPILSQWSVTNLGVGGNGTLCGTVLSTMIFAFSHINPPGSLQGVNGDSAVETLVSFVFQLCTGTIFALLHLSTQNSAVPIAAHAFCDFFAFHQTHLKVTGQMACAKKESLLPRGNHAVERKWIEKKGDKCVQDVRQTFYLMDLNRDGTAVL